MDILEHCALYCDAVNPKTQKRHDKVYYLVLARDGGAFQFRTLYGGRGEALKPGVGDDFTSEHAARVAYAAVLTEKTGRKKGYRAIPWSQYPAVGFPPDIEQAIQRVQSGAAPSRGARPSATKSRPAVAPWAAAFIAAVPAERRDHAIGVLSKRVDDATATMLEEAKARPATQVGLDWARAIFARVPPAERHGVYRALAVCFHPDLGGDLDAMKLWNDSYKRFSAR